MGGKFGWWYSFFQNGKHYPVVDEERKKSHMSQFHSPFLALLATDHGLGYSSRGGGATDLEIGPYLQQRQTKNDNLEG